MQIPNFETVKSTALLIVAMPLYAEKNAYLFHRILFHYLPNPFFVAFPSHHRRYSRIVRQKNLFLNVLPIPHTGPYYFLDSSLALWEMDSPFLSRATLAEKIILQINWRILPENRFYNMELQFFMSSEIPFGSPCLCRIHAFSIKEKNFLHYLRLHVFYIEADKLCSGLHCH